MGGVDLFDSFDPTREVWGRLALQSRNVFSTWEWATTWWRRYGSDIPPAIVACRERGEIVALLPLYVWSRRPLRVARFVGHGPADQLGPVCGPAASATAAAALLRTQHDVSLDVVLAELLAGDRQWAQLLEQRPVASEESPAIDIAGGWERYLATRSANLRQQIRRRERQLRRRHGVRFRLTVDPDSLQDDLTVLFGLHRSRWGEGSPFLRFEAFHREFAAVALERGWLRLWLLELDDRPAAAWYGFRFAGVESYYQAGRDVRLRSESLGFVLLAHSIREAAQDGVEEYRMLRGPEDFKTRFADRDPGLETYVLGRSVRATAARVAAGAVLRNDAARIGLRRLLRR